MTMLALLLLTLLQFISGMGILALFKITLRPLMHIALSIVLGIAFFSLVPFALQLFYIPLTQKNIFTWLVVGGILLNANYKYSLASYKTVARDFSVKVRLYEIPFFLLIAFMVFLSVWRCLYLPPTPRDLVSGPEVIAEYAVKEKTMINSVFTLDLSTTNNQFKPAYITSLQVIYKYAGFHFGQIWLSTIFLCFIVFLYNAINQKLHPLISGFLLCVFVAVPELYAYTIMALFDYSNAVFFFFSLYFLFRFFEQESSKYLFFSGVLMGVATYIRSETLVLAILALPIMLVHLFKKKRQITTIIFWSLAFILPAAFLYWISVPFYIDHYLPVKYGVEGMVNKDLANLSTLWDRFQLMNSKLIFSSTGVSYYGYFIYLFLAGFVLELLTQRRFTMQARNWLAAVLVVYLGLALLGWLLPLFDLDNTTRRGMLKIFPLMLLFFSGSQMLINLSNRITAWESGKRVRKVSS